MLAVGALALALAPPVRSGIGNCGIKGPCPTSTPRPSPSPTASPTATATSSPTTSPYTFDDDFSGTALASWWHHDYHCCGTVTMDPSLSVVSGGYLRQAVVNRSGSWYGDILDTKGSFSPTYGYFEARMQIPKGPGLWPAFWLYLSGVNEIDAMEVCANPLGTNGGNDASLLHNTVHYGTGQQTGHQTRTADLSLAFHVYGVDWRPDHIAFYLDGVEVWRETAAVPATAMALLVDLGIGGSWCGAAGASSPSYQYVDYVRATQ